MLSSAAYEALCTTIHSATLVQSRVLPLPMKGSKWLQRTSDTEGAPTMATLFSGGVRRVTHSEYRRSLAYVASDIEEGVTLTINEITHSALECMGARVFFELDYRSIDRALPTRAVMLDHVRLIQAVVAECFPNQTATCFAALSEPKLKPRNGTSLYPERLFWLAQGVHIVCPGINVSMLTLRRLGQLADIRLTALYPMYNHVVDIDAVHKHQASLRMLYSHKMVPCSDCVAVVSTVQSLTNSTWLGMGADKGPRQHLEKVPTTLVPTIPHQQGDDVCARCNGRMKVVHPSVYRPWCEVVTGGEVTTTIVDATIMYQLRTFSIVPARIGEIQQPVFPADTPATKDMGTGYDNRPVWKGEGTVKRGGDMEYDNPAAMKYVTLAVRAVAVQYSDSVIDTVVQRTRKGSQKVLSLLVNIKGKHSRYCHGIGREHSSNRVYFSIHLPTGKIQQKCYKKDCKPDVTKPVCVTALIHLRSIFGLSNTAAPLVMPPRLVVSGKDEVLEAEVGPAKGVDHVAKRRKTTNAATLDIQQFTPFHTALAITQLKHVFGL